MLSASISATSARPRAQAMALARISAARRVRCPGRQTFGVPQTGREPDRDRVSRRQSPPARRAVLDPLHPHRQPGAYPGEVQNAWALGGPVHRSPWLLAVWLSQFNTASAAPESASRRRVRCRCFERRQISGIGCRFVQLPGQVLPPAPQASPRAAAVREQDVVLPECSAMRRMVCATVSRTSR